MTVEIPAPDIDLVLEPPGPVGRGRRGGRAPWYLWVVAGAVMAPIVAAMAYLAARVVGRGSTASDVLFSGRTAELLGNTILLTVAVTVAALAVGAGAAWSIGRGPMRAHTVWTVLVALPLVIPSYVVALAVISATGPSGLLSDLLGVDVGRLRGFWGSWLALTISTYPFVFLPAAAAIRRLDPALEEAARGLGSSPARVFRSVVLPQLRPSIAAGGLLVALYTLSDFGAVSLMRHDVFTRVVFVQYAGRVDRTPAAVFALVLVVVALVVVVAEQWTRGRASYYRSRPVRTRVVTPPGRLGRGLVPVLVLVALVAPLGVLVTWLARGIARGQAIHLPWGAVFGSLSAAVLAALLATAASLPVGALVARYRSRLTGWVERLVYGVYALPHITVGLAVVFFASNYLGGLYQSLTLLVVVYAGLFLAQALGSTRAGMLAISPHLEEASRSLGRGPLATLTAITVPLIWRSLAAGGLLVFLTAMKELPAMLLLRPTGFDALSVEIWAAADELLYARAAAPALLLVAVSALPMYLLATRANEA